MPLYIKDDLTAGLVSELASRLGTSKQAAVRAAVQAELRRRAAIEPAADRLARFWRSHPLAEPTGQAADKAFFDELSGDV